MARAVRACRTTAEGEGRTVRTLHLARPVVATERVLRASVAQLDSIAHVRLDRDRFVELDLSNFVDTVVCAERATKHLQHVPTTAP